ncbi:TonB-dependent receptor [Hyphococcus lacteus]|uniref:TonB-dependent receptor n=1 Tax=Hyphococcus lacteus TaxID=3143536 RepID=A0ABV3Z8Q3_9PROT
MKKLYFVASVAAITAGLAVSGTAMAQDANADDTIVVTGYRLQTRESIAAKANDDRIADFLSADELGRQPDLNVADSLRRVPGVVTVFDEDEGRYVGLRGLDQRYTFISIDGGQIASTDRSDRDINIESIPPTAVKRLEVFKAVTPDLDGHSVGGVINLVTRSAFDAEGLYAVANASVGLHSNTGQLPNSFSNPSYRFDGAVSQTFFDDTIGVLFAGTYFDKKRDQGRSIIGVGSNATGDFVNEAQPLDYANQIVRWNGLAKFEYKPNDNFHVSLTASRFDYQYDEVRTQFRIYEEGLTQTSATTGNYSAGEGLLRFDKFPLGQTIDNLQGKVEFRPTERGLLEVAAYYSHGVQGHPYPNASFRTGSLPGLGYSYDFDGESVDDGTLASVTLNDPTVLQNGLDQFQFQNYYHGNFRNEEDVTEFKADYSWNMESDEPGFGFKVGVKYRNLEKDRYDEATNFTLADPSTVLTVQDFIDAGSESYTVENLGFNYPHIDEDLFTDFLFANPGLFDAVDASNANSFYDIQEDVTAGYGMLSYRNGPHTLIGGLRYERTEVATVATLNGGPEQVARKIDYGHFLPSVVYSFEISPQMKIRAGFAEALGRPNHPDLAGAETFDEVNLTIRRANTDLKPRESKSFDLGFEWYIDRGQFFSVAAFHKIIKNQITSVSSEEVINGDTYTVTQPINLDQIEVSGLEISYTDDTFEFLPAPFDGFGVAANLTLMNGIDGPAPDGNLLSQPDYLYNVAALYAKGPFSAKVTYNYVDDRPTSATRAETSYEQLDAQVRWQLTDNFQVQLEGRNLLNNPRTNYYTDTNHLREINDFGNSYWFTIAYKY